VVGVAVCCTLAVRLFLGGVQCGSLLGAWCTASPAPPPMEVWRLLQSLVGHGWRWWRGVLVLQGSGRLWWTPALRGRAILGLRWLLLLVGRGRHRQSAERPREFMQVRRWRSGGGGVALPPSSGVRSARVVFVGFVWASSTSTLGVRCWRVCLMLMS
jgi:hypothetical protein